jgi:hypothetical protein
MSCPKEYNLKFVLNKRYDQTLTLNWLGDTPDKISPIKPNNFRQYTTDELKGISKINSISYDIENQNQYQFVKIFFRYKSGDAWSNQMEISEIEGLEINHLLPFKLELNFYYSYNVDPSSYGFTNILINSIVINGEYILTSVDSEALVTPENPEIILKPKDIYKIFRLDGFEITKQDTGLVDYKILYRFTQNGGRTYTPFEPLTQENISSIKLDELRFAQVEYLIKLESNVGALMIYDIILLGKFQNVSANYLNINRYGLKQECISFLLDNGASSDIMGINSDSSPWTNSNSSNAFPNNPNNEEGVTDFTGINLHNVETNGLACYLNKDATTELTYNQGEEGIGSFWGVGGSGDDGFNLWNPYNNEKIIKWENFLANNMNSIFGWKVNYFITDPDENGVDRYMHEYQLKNVVKVEQIKIIVPENNFPDENLKLNYFNLDLFDTFEINILKDEFKRGFGIEKRPSQDDIIHICVTNKLYYVKHTQAIRKDMNAMIHYKLTLEKYEKRADIDVKDEDSKNILDSLQENTDIEELLQPEKKQNEDEIANKEQSFSLAYEKIRQKIVKGVKIIKQKLWNDNIVISRNHYDFSELNRNQLAVNYKKIDQILKKNENRTFISWFNFKSNYDENKHLSTNTFKKYYVENETYILLNNFDIENKLGYRWFNERDRIFFQLNENTYEFPVELYTDIWYGLLIKLNQRQQKLNIKLFRRNYDISVIMFNRNTYERKDLITTTTIDDSYDPDNTNYTYLNAISDNFLPVKNNETNYYAKENSKIDKLILIDEIEFDIQPDEFEHTKQMELLSSPLRFTNLRIFDDIIKNESETNILSQDIIKDEQHLIMWDNANREIKTLKHFNRRFE